MPSTDLKRVEAAPGVVQALSDRERKAYQYFCQGDQDVISEELSGKLLELFQQGKDCEEIRRLHPGIGLGQIVHARVRDRWDEKKDASLYRLRTEVPQSVERTQLESAAFLSKWLLVAHKKYGDKLDQFLATGNEALLVGTPFESMTLRGYREVLEALAKATGQDQKKTVKVTGGITVTPVRPNAIPPASAAALLKGLKS